MASVGGQLMLESAPWSPSELRNRISIEAGDARHGGGPSQVEYLGRHLGEHGLDARWMVIERSYRDRYFIDEFAAYYARCQQPCPPVCTRLHFFDGEESLADVEGLLTNALQDGTLQHLESDLCQRYLGFIVVRPIPSVPIGRTVLRTLEDDASAVRHFPGLRDYTVHLAGLRLNVRGVAFQQQDQAVGACATTAMWSALQIALPRDGMRPPTPAALTVAANRHLLISGRPFPATLGLTTEQMCEALRACGTDPVLFSQGSGVAPHVLEQLILISLKSRMPVILALKNGSLGHAVTAVGYRSDEPASVHVGAHNMSFHQGQIDRLYIQDDRLGPYARAFMARCEGKLHLGIPFVDRDNLHHLECSLIRQVIVPQYPKLRASALDLLNAPAALYPMLARHADNLARKLSFDLYFARSGEILGEIGGRSVRPTKYARFLSEVRLSRYVGVVTLYFDGIACLTLLLDATDMIRTRRVLQQTLGIVATHRDFYAFADNLGGYCGRPVG